MVVIVLAASLTFILMKPSSATGSEAMGTPNIVPAQDVGKDLGGTWTQKMGSSGVISSSSGIADLLSNSVTGISPTSFLSKSPIASDLPVSPTTRFKQSSINSPIAQFPLSSFEVALFSPSKMGFASVGYLQFTNSSDSVKIFNMVYENASNTASSTSIVYKGVYDGHKIVYAWNSTVIGQGSSAHNYNISVLIGLDDPYVIFLFYMVTSNDTLHSFEALFGDQVSMVSGISSKVTSDFVTTSILNTTLNSDYTQALAVQISISNASSMLNTIYSLEGYSTTTSSYSSTYSQILNQTLGNLTHIGAAVYVGNSSGNLSGVLLGYASFENDSASSSLFTLLEGYVANSPIYHAAKVN
ncbi:MAG: hypothetical protein ACP5UV_00780, partial [Thermoplasmata archaeon]